MPVVRQRFLAEWILMFLLLPSAIVWLDSKPGLLEANGVLYDRALRSRPPAVSNDILIVGVDKRTLDALGAWPLQRSVHAEFLEGLVRHAPRAVLLDFFFDKEAANRADDDRLAQAMRRLPVYLPLNYLPAPAGDPRGQGMFLPPTPALAREAAAVGHANATPDADGLVRGIWRFEASRTRLWPYIGLAMAGRSATPAEDLPEGTSDRGRRGWFGLRFSGAAGTYPTVPYLDVLEGRAPAELLRGKYILVGALESSGLGDTMPVGGIGPLASLPGVEIHANALRALLEDDLIEAPGDWRRVLWISFFVWMALILFLKSGSHALAITLVLSAVCAMANYLLLTQARISLPLASPLFGIALAYLIWSWRRMNALLLFFRQRAEALNAVPAGAFEPPQSIEAPVLDTIERRTHALDRAIHRLTRLQSLLTEGVWQLPVPVLICNGQGIVSQSNAAARELLVAPLPVVEPAASPISDDALRAADLPALLAEMRKVRLTGAVVPDDTWPWQEALQHEFTTPLGNVFRVRAAPIGNGEGDGGARAGWVVVLPDVTAERRAQKEREQWFGFLSHDLRGPQVTILNLLALHAEGNREVSVERLMKGVDSEARRTIELAETFMDMVEAESGVYRFEHTIGGAVVLDAIDAVWGLAQTQGVRIDSRLGEADCNIVADASLLTRALVNILRNAIQASPRGSCIEICLDADVDAQADLDDVRGEAVIAIRDAGKGMTLEQVERLRHDAEGRRSGQRGSGKGWGIGMAIVHAVVKKHGGWLDIHSAPDAGTTFLIGLPLDKA